MLVCVKPKTKLDVLFRIICLSFIVSPLAAKSVVIFKTFTNVKWRRGTEKKINLAVLVQEWDIPRKKRKVPVGS